jgi:lipopolysaccharide export system permease protein
MKIYFRYLFIRLLIPFGVTLFACTILWIMVDLYGNIDDFLEHRINVWLILHFYSLQIPIMLVLVLPAALLFSTLWTLLSLNRRSELVAFQSGGMAPAWLFTPFVVFAAMGVVVLWFDMSGPSAESKVTRDRLLMQVKGQDAKRNVFLNLPYVDRVNRRVWFFQSLDINQGTAKGVEILLRDEEGHDLVKYCAESAKWTGEQWRLRGVLEIIFGAKGSLASQKTYEEKYLDITTPPSQLSLIVSQPDQLTVAQLSEYIRTSTSSQENLAKYRTEWWYRMVYPLSPLVLLPFGLLFGTWTNGRRGVAAVSVFLAIFVLVAYFIGMSVFLAVGGEFNRLSPFISAAAAEAIFGGVGFYLLAMQNGWWWQVREWWKQWRVQGKIPSWCDPRLLWQ